MSNEFEDLGNNFQDYPVSYGDDNVISRGNPSSTPPVIPQISDEGNPSTPPPSFSPIIDLGNPSSPPPSLKSDD